MLRQQRLRCDYACDLSEDFTTKLLGSCGQPASLIVRKSHSTVADLLPKNTIFLDQVFDDLLLPLIHPTGNGYDNKGEWIQNRSHSGRLPRRKRARSLKTEQNRVFVPYAVERGYRPRSISPTIVRTMRFSVRTDGVNPPGCCASE